MTKHDLIFSNQRRHRAARHIAFWIFWCLSYNLLFHYPIHVFKEWDTRGPGTLNYRDLGPVLFFIKSFIVNSFLGVIVPQIALTYVLIYWLLPNYYFQRKNPFLVTAITASVLLIFYYLAIVFKYSPEIYNKVIAGTVDTLRPFPAFDEVVLIDQLSSLPFVLGFALLIKFVKRWWNKQKETELLAKEKTKAEIEILKAQVHPHFLFNTLNNIYFFTLTGSPEAPVMIKKLSGMLHYILFECSLPLVSLDKEIKMIREYMDLEKIRYADHMQMTIDITGNPEGKLIAPLLIIPFIENSFKHGASKVIKEPWVKLKMTIQDNRLHLLIINSKPSISESAKSKGNIGLKNVIKRLELLYPGTHELKIVSETGSYTVDISLQLYEIKNQTLHKEEIKRMNEYAMA